MSGARRVFLFFALAVVSVLLAAGLGAFPKFRELLVWLALGFVLAAIAVFIRDMLISRKDPYDLGELRRIHDQEELGDLEPLEPTNFDQVLCRHCGAVYSSRFPICPDCKMSPNH